jgi:hypothetical protein
LQQSRQLGLKGLVLKIVEFDFYSGVILFVGLSGFLPDGDNLCVGLQMQNLNDGLRLSEGRERSQESAG